MELLKASILAGAGGFVGTCMRFLSEKLGGLICHSAFPLGTFMANILGCLLIGIFYGWLNKSGLIGKKGDLFLITGLCGGFTTFSSMSDELLGLLDKGDTPMFWIYLATSLVLGFIAVAVGIACVPNKVKPAAQAAK